MKTVHVYQYPKCSTCRRALRFLDDHGVTYTKSDLVAEPISLVKMTDLFRRSGLPLSRMFNTSGESYRTGDFKSRLRTMTEAEALAALASDGKLVKRPIVNLGADSGACVLVGFDEDAYLERFGR